VIWKKIFFIQNMEKKIGNFDSKHIILYHKLTITLIFKNVGYW
jgi:hypothetical protein